MTLQDHSLRPITHRSSWELAWQEINVFVYALKDPRTGLVHRVDSAADPLRQVARFMGQSGTKGLWLQGLRNEGLYPVVSLLDEVAVEEAPKAIRAWCQRLRASGHPADEGLF